MREHILVVFVILLLSCTQNEHKGEIEFMHNDGEYNYYIIRGEKIHQVLVRDSLGVLVKKYLIDDKYQRNGYYTEYHSNGLVKREINQIENLNHGEFREFYIDGTLRIIGNYYLNSREGEFYYYKEDGKLHAVEVYESGKRVVLEFVNESGSNDITIYPNIIYYPELPGLNDTLAFSVFFSEQAINRFERPIVGYVIYDFILMESSEIPDKLGSPEHMFRMDGNQLDIIFLIYDCSPNALFYGYTIVVDTISKDTIEMKDFFEIITMNCIDI